MYLTIKQWILFKLKLWGWDMPKNGQRIRITYLPFNNGKPNKNIWIGTEGIVHDAKEHSFSLKMESGAWLVVYMKNRKGKRKPINFEILKTPKA